MYSIDKAKSQTVNCKSSFKKKPEEIVYTQISDTRIDRQNGNVKQLLVNRMEKRQPKIVGP